MNAPPETLKARYQRFNERVEHAAHAAGRKPAEILTVAVTKYAPVEAVRRLIDMGHKDLGENQVQQLTQRADLIAEMERRHHEHRVVAARDHALFSHAEQPEQPEPTRWHMIGSLQRNKVKKVLPVARLIHAVDSLRLVDEINAVAVRKDIDPEVLVQVNVTGESQKSGCPVGAAQHLCEQIDALVHVHIRGLMVIGPTSQDENETNRVFERTRELFDDIKDAGVNPGKFNILSMGMSGDFELAIKHGANMLRIGSAIFGPRPPMPPGENGDHESDQPDE